MRSIKKSVEDSTVSVIICSANITSPLYLSVTTNSDKKFKALLDSGASANFIHSRLVQKLNLTPVKTPVPVSVTTIDGSSIKSGKI